MTPIQIKSSRAARFALTAIAIAASGIAVLAQNSVLVPPSDTPTIKGSAEEVLLDLIVRDKKGKPVRDLAASDISVTDNGKPVEIKSFRLVEGKEAIDAGGKSRAKVPLDAMRQIRLVTLVFERLGDEGRRLSRQAGLDLLKNDLGPNVFYSVFAIDRQLSALQAFTNDRDLLRQAVERATSGAYNQFAADSLRIRTQLETMVGDHAGRSVEEKIGEMSQDSSGARGAPGGGSIAAMQARLMLTMLQSDEKIAVEQAGRSSIYSLLSLVRGQILLPGRKTVVYLTEGLNVPVSLEEQFHAVISAANRANVSVYPIDARGLISGRQNQGSTDSLASAAAATRSQNNRVGGAVTPEESRALDRAEDSIRGNVRGRLLELADSTGGFLIADTNDLRLPLHKINEEINSYYELTYNPHIENYDGRFRKIAVRTERADLKVQTRSGYFALPESAGNVTMLPYEVPLLKALESKPAPRSFEFHAAGIRVHPVGESVECALIVEVPMKSVTFTEDKPANINRARISLVALVKDGAGTVVQKVTKDQPVTVPPEKLNGIKMGNFTYLEHFLLPPGRFTVETAVYDGEASRASVRKSVLLIPKPTAGVNISNISIVRRFEPGGKDADLKSPFFYNDGTITPTLNDTIERNKGASISLFFAIYPDPKMTDPARLVLEYLQDGKVLARLDPALPAPDATGRISYVASSSAEAMPPGIYEVRAFVTQGPSKAMEATTFTVEPPVLQ